MFTIETVQNKQFPIKNQEFRPKLKKYNSKYESKKKMFKNRRSE